MSDNLLENLNEEQLRAVTHVDGPLMIIAGAGTGKTTVISHRISWLVEQVHANPDEILALTFTEKAATEMEERVDRLLPMGYVDLWISTFHSFCERILKEHAIDIGLPHEFKLLNEVDALLLMRRNFDRFKLDYYKPRGNPTRFIKALLQHFSRVKDEMVTVKDYLKHANDFRKKIGEDSDEISEADRLLEVANAYQVYQEILLENSVFDFADLVSYTVELFKKRPNILKKYRDQFKFILVDEFQDTNRIQYELVKLLTEPLNNLTVVGDDDQSIYKFRGASLSNIMKFREDFPKTTSVVLNKNYRSTAKVLEYSYKLIQQNNPHRLEVQEKINKELQPHKKEEGRVEHIHCSTVEEEVTTVVQSIIDLKNETSCDWSDFCILVRANSSAEPFISLMDRSGMPYKFMAMSGLYMKPIILDSLAWMRVIVQPHDSPSFFRILSHPRLGINELDIARISLHCRKRTVSIHDALVDLLSIEDISDDTHQKVTGILESISTLRSLAKRLPVNELFVKILEESGLLGDVRVASEFDQQELFSLLKQFYQRLRKFESANDDKTLYQFLLEFDHEREAGEVGSLENDPEGGPDVVNIMTIHGSKGLEFRYVFIVNLIEQRFPSTRKRHPIPIPNELVPQDETEKDPHISEERRLFYVALTRAKEAAFLFSAEDYGGSRKRKVSRFIKELGLEETKLENQSQNKIKSKIKLKPEIQNIKPETISFTQITAFSTCPLQYKFAHILKVPVFGKHSLSFGKSMHETLHKFMLEVHNSDNNKIPDKKELLKIYEDTWIDEWYPDKDLKSEYFKKGKQQLLDYHKRIIENPPEIFALEKDFSLKIGGVTIRGRIDRIDRDGDGVEIIDYKTGKPKTKLTWDEKRQLVLYQLAGESCFSPPLKVAKLTYHYLEDNSCISFVATEKDKEKLEQEICSTVEKIGISDFSADPGFGCQYCDFKDICEFSKS